MKRLFLPLIIAATLLFGGCKHDGHDSDMVVTIAPLKHIVEQITCGDFRISVLVPAGSSPESYEPTPKQIAEANDAQFIFSTGLIPFEQSLLEELSNTGNIVDLSRGIDLIEGSCSHHHSTHHHHGVDPHIWTSPRELRQMATNAYEAIIAHYPDSVKYTASYNDLVRRIDSLDTECQQLIHNTQTQALLVYHPALTYYARAYGIEQITVENEGKEPSAKHLAAIIDKARTMGITAVLYQREYPKSVVEVIANDIGATAIEIDPLAEDIEQTIIDITRAITTKK